MEEALKLAFRYFVIAGAAVGMGASISVLTVWTIYKWGLNKFAGGIKLWPGSKKK